MPNEIISMDDPDKSGVTAAKAVDIAQSLRRYLVSGNKKEEEKLIEELNKKPGFLQRLFPTEGQKTLQKISSDQLQKIRGNETEIMNLHHALYVEAINIQTHEIVEIEWARSLSKIGVAKLDFTKKLAKIVDTEVKEIMETVSASQKQMIKKFRDDMREHKAEYTDPEDAEFLEAASKQTRENMAAHMEITANLIKNTSDSIKSHAEALARRLSSNQK